MLRSKIGISLAILVTLISSLCLAVGSCAYFGFRPLHSQGKYVYPVLNGLVGFENSMVLIRCVASIPQHLDVKIRIARGLAREGRTIAKYYFIMLTFVTIALFLFIPIVQEICIYGCFVLISDLAMQLVFLMPVLSIDLQRVHDSRKNIKQDVLMTTSVGNAGRCGARHGYIKTLNSNLGTRTGIPNLHRRNAPTKSTGEDRVAPPSSEPTKAVSEMPKRLRLTYFVTSKRMFQRMILCVFIGWVAWIFYTSSGLYDHLEHSSNYGPGLASVILKLKTKSNENLSAAKSTSKFKNKVDSTVIESGSSQIQFDNSHFESLLEDNDRINKKPSLKVDGAEKTNTYGGRALSFPSELHSSTYNKSYPSLRHLDADLSNYLPDTHWPTLFSYYNRTLRGEYISLLPPVLLSVPVTVQDALSVHHPHDPNDEPWTPVPKPGQLQELKVICESPFQLCIFYSFIIEFQIAIQLD